MGIPVVAQNSICHAQKCIAATGRERAQFQIELDLEYGEIPESTQIAPKGGRALVDKTLESIQSLWEKK